MTINAKYVLRSSLIGVFKEAFIKGYDNDGCRESCDLMAVNLRRFFYYINN